MFASQRPLAACCCGAATVQREAVKRSSSDGAKHISHSRMAATLTRLKMYATHRHCKLGFVGSHQLLDLGRLLRRRLLCSQLLQALHNDTLGAIRICSTETTRTPCRVVSKVRVSHSLCQ